MKDPDIKAAGGPSDPGFTPTDFERQLLDSARADSIPPALKQSMQRALHASLAGTAAGSVVSIWASKAGLLLVVSVAALGSIAGYRLLHATTPRAPATVEPAIPAAPVTAPASAPQLSAAEPMQLHEEIALLDRARAALQARSPQRALGLLAQHAERFPQPSLAPEADVLRIEALVQNRELGKARALAKRFLSEHAESPLADRVRSLAR
jgi:hypothetical protein